MAVLDGSRSLVVVTSTEPTHEVWRSRPFAPERYVSRSELAEIMGVSLATVDRMVAEGMPSVTWGRRTRRFRPSLAISWATERGRAA